MGKSLRAVLFDFDGTLADTLPLIYRAFREMWVEVDGKERSDEEIRGLFGPPEEEVIQRGVPGDRLEASLADFYRRYGELHGTEVRPVPEVLRLLRGLKEEGYRVGVVTGKGRRSAEISLVELGMSDFIDTLVTGSEVRRYKPHPEGIQIALDKLGCLPEEGVYVGDSPVDVRAGKEAGLTTVGVRWFPGGDNRPFDPEPEVVVESVKAFRDWLDTRSGPRG